jgi:hypothetical protein
MSNNQLSHFPDPQEFLIDTPLYKYVDVRMYGYEYSDNLQNLHQTIDAFCIQCSLQSIYSASPSRYYSRNLERFMQEYTKDKEFEVKIECSRNSDHKMYFYFIQRNGLLMKVGQLPSVADIVEQKVGKYRKILGDKYVEFTKAIGLSSHGIGIGSYVYLRRIFEKLIQNAYLRAQPNIEIKPEEFKCKTMEDKITLLNDYLPKVLVKNANIYGILSKGLHELSEEECLDYFATIQKAIEFILDEEIERKEHEDNEKKITDEIGRITGEVKK